MPRVEPPRETAVFINCPFDEAYRPLLRAMCFTVIACGYTPRSALDYSDSAEVRFQKILDIITACDRSIHDLSRVEVDPQTRLPRFNMPLELGADLALRLKGPRGSAVGALSSLTLNRIVTIRPSRIYRARTSRRTEMTSGK